VPKAILKLLAAERSFDLQGGNSAFSSLANPAAIYASSARSWIHRLAACLQTGIQHVRAMMPPPFAYASVSEQTPSKKIFPVIGSVNEKDFLLYFQGTEDKGGNAGRRNYRADYIFAANYLAAVGRTKAYQRMTAR
jgi:hypothetical protein